MRRARWDSQQQRSQRAGEDPGADLKDRRRVQRERVRQRGIEFATGDAAAPAAPRRSARRQRPAAGGWPWRTSRRYSSGRSASRCFGGRTGCRPVRVQQTRADPSAGVNRARKRARPAAPRSVDDVVDGRGCSDSAQRFGQPVPPTSLLRLDGGLRGDLRERAAAGGRSPAAPPPWPRRRPGRRSRTRSEVATSTRARSIHARTSGGWDDPRKRTPGTRPPASSLPQRPVSDADQLEVRSRPGQPTRRAARRCPCRRTAGPRAAPSGTATAAASADPDRRRSAASPGSGPRRSPASSIRSRTNSVGVRNSRDSAPRCHGAGCGRSSRAAAVEAMAELAVTAVADAWPRDRADAVRAGPPVPQQHAVRTHEPVVVHGHDGRDTPRSAGPRRRTGRGRTRCCGRARRPAGSLATARSTARRDAGVPRRPGQRGGRRGRRLGIVRQQLLHLVPGGPQQVGLRGHHTVLAARLPVAGVQLEDPHERLRRPALRR